MHETIAIFEAVHAIYSMVDPNFQKFDDMNDSIE